MVIDGRAWRERLDIELRAAAQLLPEVGPFQADGSIRVSVSAHLVQSLQRCPAAELLTTAPFAWTPARAAHKLMVMALAELVADPRTTAPRAVRTVVDRLTAGTDELGRWLDSLDDGGRAVVVRRAGTQAVAARAHLRWPPQAELTPGPVRYALVTRPVELTARVDLTSNRRGRPHTIGLIVSGDGHGDADVLAGHAALTVTANRAMAPEQVVVVAPAGGSRLSRPVDDQMLEQALSRAVDALAAVVGHREGVEPERFPGRHCGWCEHRSGCDPGQRWLARPGREAGIFH